MAADGGSDVVDLDFSVQIGKAFLDKIRNGPRIFVAGGLGNVAFAGVGEATHGQHNRQRKPGSIGACSTPSRVFKGMRMGGQTGGDRITVQNLEVLKVIPENNLLLVKGSIPGAKGSYVIIEK